MAAKQKEMAAIRAQLSEIKDVLGKADLRYSQNKEILPAMYIPPHRRYGGEYSRKKCVKCETEKKIRCFHCFGCGSVEHRVFRCPNKKNE